MSTDGRTPHVRCLLCRSTTANGGLPFGGFVLYDCTDPAAAMGLDVSAAAAGTPEEDDDGGGGGRGRTYEDEIVLARNFGPDREARQNPNDSLESLFAQYFSLCVFPTAEFVCSSYHAGEGQVSGDSVVHALVGRRSNALHFRPSQVAFGGSNCRRKADLLVSVEEDEVELESDADLVDVEVSPGHWVRPHPPRPKRANKRRFLKFLNADGMIYHPPFTHRPSCPKAPVAAADPAEDYVHREEEEDVGVFGRGVGDGGGAVRDDQHELKVRYAEWMTAVDPDHLVVTWDRVSECRLAHHGTPPDPARWNRGVSGGTKRLAKHDAWHKYGSIREYLEAEHGYDSCLGIREKSFTQRQLVDRILASPYDSEGGEFSGFCVIVGGREADDLDDGVHPDAFGFCHQRSVVTEDDVGEFTKLQVRLTHPGNPAAAAKALAELTSKKRTVVRRSFPEQGGELVTLDYLRFLIRHRGFRGFKVLHYVAYRSKRYTSGYVTDLIRQRQVLRIRDDPRDRLMIILLKVP